MRKIPASTIKGLGGGGTANKNGFSGPKGGGGTVSRRKISGGGNTEAVKMKTRSQDQMPASRPGGVSGR